MGDVQKDTTPQIWRNVVDITDEVETPLGYDPPVVVVDARGLIVIFKPAGWETDVYDVAKYGVPITPVARFYLLSSFLAANFPKEAFPICHSVTHGFGFVHRLDQMSSGLIIGTTCFESHFYLQWQMCCYFIAREYFVSCHGFPISSLDKVCGRILEGAIRARSTYGERCRVDERGKPASSRIHSVSHLHLEQGQEPLGLVIIKILTGRQHQIRVHLQHVG